MKTHTKHFLELYYKNSIAKLFAAFMEEGDVSDEEMERLREMLNQKTEEER